MGSPKTLVKFGALAALEPTTAYGTPVTLAATSDGQDIITPPEPDIDWVHGGERGGKSPAERSSRQRVGRMGRFGKFKLEYEPAGAGAAYDNSPVVVPNVHQALLMGGMVAAFSTASASESVTYTPAASGSEQSGTVEVYYRGQKYPFAGVYANWTLTMPTPGIPKLSLDAMGLMSALPTDSSIPSITYSQFINPAKAEGVNLKAVLVIGTATATFTVGKIDSLELTCENDIQPRALDNVTGLHGGFNMGVERKFGLKAVIESEAITTASPYAASAGFNIFKLMELATTTTLSFTIGGTQYARYTISAPAAQLVASPEQAKGAASMWECNWELKPTTLTANDECSILFN